MAPTVANHKLKKPKANRPESGWHMSKDVTLTIDGFEVTVPEGTLIVNAAKMAGIDIPVFCYHPKMEPVGMCRMCLVEIGRPVRDRETGELVREPDGSPKISFGPKLETACTTPVTEGMVVLGTTDKARAGREDIIEFLLTSHPLDCPICDKGGECPLQNLTMGFGPGVSRFIYDEKMRLAKHYPLGDLIVLDRERCIQCGRCVRFQDEIVDDPVLSFYQRGRALEIVTYSEPGFDSYWSGNTTDICPVGALTTTDFRFKARPWELKAPASICNQCPVGCNITYNTRREAVSGGDWVIKRMMPRQNEWVNEIWICDKGRFGYHYTRNQHRLTRPLVRRDGELTPATWEEALEVVTRRFREAGDGLFTLAGGRLSNEDLFNLKQLTEGLGGKIALYADMGGGDILTKVGMSPDSNLGDLGEGDAIFVIACDLEEEAPLWWLRIKQAAERGARLIVANPRPTKLDRAASETIRYAYGSETAVVLAALNQISAKRPELPEGGEGLDRDPGVRLLADVMRAAENAVVIYGSEGLGLAGSQSLAQACANLLLTTDHTGRPNNGLIAAWQRANEQGAWELGLRPEQDLQAALENASALYIVAADPAGDDPALVEFADFLVVQELFLTPTAKLADVVLPVLAYTEREGSYTNGERRVQRFYPAVPEPAGLSADFAVAGMIGERLGLNLEFMIPSRVMDRIASTVPAFEGITYARLSEVVEQWPIVGRGDMYYGGTTYDNSQGLGKVLRSDPSGLTLSWPEQHAAIELTAENLLAVPVTRLYDRGTTLLPSVLLQQRIPEPYVALHPATAELRGIREGESIQVSIQGVEALVEALLDESLPENVLIVPRSMGVPISGPAAAIVKLIEPQVV